MKKTDLRIGNFISINFGNCDDGKIITVDGVSDCEIYNEEHGYSPCNEFNPIMITEQWLLDLGFNQNIETQWYIHFDNMCLTLYGYSEQYIVEIENMETDDSSIFLMSIQYVHQLQNLFFALAQEELILKEEKKPLFITEDGVEIFEGDEYIAIGINYDFGKVDTVAHDQVYSGDVMRFKYESNADEYILWNKPLLSLNDIDETIEMYTHEFEELIKLAKERSEK